MVWCRSKSTIQSPQESVLMLYLLDTNICIYLMKESPPEVAARFAELGRDDVAMSSITLAELRFGVEVSQDSRRNEKALDSLLEDIPVVSFDVSAAVVYGRLRALVRDRRRDALDRLIAAHAISLDAVVVTNNEADFNVYPGLRVENWVSG